MKIATGAPAVVLNTEGNPDEIHGFEDMPMTHVLVPENQGNMAEGIIKAIEYYRNRFGNKGRCVVSFDRDKYGIVVGPEAE